MFYIVQLTITFIFFYPIYTTLIEKECDYIVAQLHFLCKFIIATHKNKNINIHRYAVRGERDRERESVRKSDRAVRGGKVKLLETFYLQREIFL